MVNRLDFTNTRFRSQSDLESGGNMIFKRFSGILCNPTSFQSRFDVGDLGSGAYAFIDFLKKSDQRLWQILPLGPTGYGDSPYQSFSTFAGNHLLISPDLLVDEGLLDASDLDELPTVDPCLCNYGRAYEIKNPLLKKAFANFIIIPKNTAEDGSFVSFCVENAYWLDDYCLFRALKSHFMLERETMTEDDETYTDYQLANMNMDKNLLDDCFFGAVWLSWPRSILERRPSAMAYWRQKLHDDIIFHKFLQYKFFTQWQALQKYAHQNDVRIIGDIPIYVALDSADVWANKELFTLDKSYQPALVAGVPPDYFSVMGQLWGNPLYDWERHAKTNYKWWTRRIQKMLQLVDFVRIDHFRGLQSYWAVPAGSKTAISGKWLKGPGSEMFNVMRKRIRRMPIIAEDLGIITKDVTKMREECGFPGMKVAQFGFGSVSENQNLPHYVSINTVYYSGTHDNDTTIGWYKAASEEEKDQFRRYMNVDGHEPNWDLIRLIFLSTARFAIAPIQDILSMGSESRMNIPGIALGNWKFRFPTSILSDSIAERLKYLSKLSDRNLTALSQPGILQSNILKNDEPVKRKYYRIKQVKQAKNYPELT